MKPITTLMRLASPLGSARFLALLTTFFLIAAPHPAFGQGSGSPAGDEEGGNDSDETSGDETVGTLPSVLDEDPTGPIGMPGKLGVPSLSGDGALVFEGSSAAVLDLLRRTRTNGLVGVQLDGAGRARVALVGDFRVRLRAETFAALQLEAHLSAANGLDARVLWNRRANPVHLASGDDLALPLGDLATSPALLRSPLTIDSVNARGVVTRLSLSLDDGFVVLSQVRR